MNQLIAATSLDDALTLAEDISRRGIPCLVPLPSGQCWRYANGTREREATTCECDEIPCVILEGENE